MKILESLFQRKPSEIKLGLERMRNACAACGNPQNAFQSIHVAGTNGKGSVCAFVESIIREAGYNTALYTSPHLIDFEERYRIKGCQVTSRQWIPVFKKIKHIIFEFDLTFFEAATLLAFELFRQYDIEWAVIETGLGGRLDATNVLNPQLSIITSIGIDHQMYLGETVELIAQEKLGIVKSKVPLVMADTANADVKKRALTKVQECETTVDWVPLPNSEYCDSLHPKVPYGHGRIIELSTAGGFQSLNASLALRACEKLSLGDFDIWHKALSNVKIVGRMDLRTIDSNQWIFDVAHNPDAVDMLIDSIVEKKCDKDLLMIVGIMKDKNYTPMIEKYAAIATHLVFVQPQNERSAKAGELAQVVPRNFTGKIILIPEIATAVSSVRGFHHGTVCVTGSFYTVGEAMAELGIKVYDQSE